MANVLLLGSKSPSRRMLLKESQIPFIVVEQDADETQCGIDLPLQDLVLNIALHKMNHVVLPQGKNEGEQCFVLTADTMTQDKNGTIHGKPVDRDDAITKIKSARSGSFLCTGYVLDKKIWLDGKWLIEQRIENVVCAEYLFNIPNEWIETYLEKSLGLQCAGAIAVEGFGMPFLKTVQGSYSTIIGLPLFEVRESLEKIGFF